jgi:hypothetical protein
LDAALDAPLEAAAVGFVSLELLQAETNSTNTAPTSTEYVTRARLRRIDIRTSPLSLHLRVTQMSET